ncbi:Transcription elongation factor B (SIII), polypeptide 1 (15kDa, elongin C) [Ascosphaera acerosa]|nr:Transcription elongation factor B (SIII), polypeptide 1 (15kDa, elongin C) [Ascosphaera acerosa]
MSEATSSTATGAPPGSDATATATPGAGNIGSGTKTDYVTLCSYDGFEFIIARELACISETIRRMLDAGDEFTESATGRIYFDNISGIVLEKVCEYFLYNDRNKDQMNVPDMDIPPELCLELVMAADYLAT